MTNPPIFFEKVKLNMIWVVQASLQKMIKGRCQKKRENVGILKKVFFCIQNSFCGAKTCFTIGGEMVSDQFDHVV